MKQELKTMEEKMKQDPNEIGVATAIPMAPSNILSKY